MTSAVMEFVGLCGAGKSTLHAGLMPLLEQSGMRFHSRRPQSVAGLAALSAGLSCAAVMARRGAAGFLLRRAHWWLPMKLGYRQAQRRLHPGPAGEWQVEMDTGLLQPVVSFAAEYNAGLAPVPVSAALAAVDLPHIAIHVTSTPDLALQRYVARDAARLVNADRRQLAAQFDQAAGVLNEIVHLCRQSGVIVLDIDAERNRDADAVAALAAQIRNAMEGKN